MFELFTLKNSQLCINIAFLCAMIILVVYNIKQNQQIDHMSNTDDVTKAVRDIYDIDVAAIRNLSNLAGKLLEEDESLTVPGNLTTTGTISGKVSNNIIEQVIPIGTIVAWSGAKNTIPNGWVPCDGSNAKAPNLVDRFIMGRNSNIMCNDNTCKGGSFKINFNNLPQHTHTTRVSAGKGANYAQGPCTNLCRLAVKSDGPIKSSNATVASSTIQDYHQPYYKLAYIMFVGF